MPNYVRRWERHRELSKLRGLFHDALQGLQAQLWEDASCWVAAKQTAKDFSHQLEWWLRHDQSVVLLASLVGSAPVGASTTAHCW